MTEAEKLLWSKVRKKQLKGYQFYRQKNIGNYIVDFYCPAAKLVIELDGGQHYSPKGKEKDKRRDAYLVSIHKCNAHVSFANETPLKSGALFRKRGRLRYFMDGH